MTISNLPQDIGGYQHIENGPMLDGDIWVSQGRPEGFIPLGLYISAEEANMYGAPRRRVYRKIPTPSNRHDKAQWGEVEKAGFDSHLTPEQAKYIDELIAAEPHIALSSQDNQPKSYIPQDDKQRKLSPMARGLLHYFPAALFEVASHSMASDMKHNPGSKDGPTWARSKSSDHADCIIRHMIDAGKGETDEEVYHLTAIAWRALAQLQEAMEKRGAKPGVSSR